MNENNDELVTEYLKCRNEIKFYGPDIYDRKILNWRITATKESTKITH